MRYFPAILPGNTVQYPAKRRRFQRTVENITPSGATYRGIDDGHALWQWDLVFQDITALQRQQFDLLFDECRGRLYPFLFLDPFQNLVRHSDALDDVAWEKTANVVVNGNQPDPLGGSRACRLSNASGATGGIKQRLAVPAWVTYTASCWLRATVSATAEMLVHPAGSAAGYSVTLTPAWQRYRFTITHASAAEEIDAGLKVPDNTEIFAFGFQLEQSCTISDYKRTNAESGIHVNSRFAHDELRWVTSGVDHHSTRITIQSPILT